jgi:hypothetical protein
MGLDSRCTHLQRRVNSEVQPQTRWEPYSSSADDGLHAGATAAAACACRLDNAVHVKGLPCHVLWDEDANSVARPDMMAGDDGGGGGEGVSRHGPDAEAQEMNASPSRHGEVQGMNSCM